MSLGEIGGIRLVSLNQVMFALSHFCELVWKEGERSLSVCYILTTAIARTALILSIAPRLDLLWFFAVNGDVAAG